MSEQKREAVTVFRPSGSPRAIVQIAHGMAEHRGRYEDFARFLQSQGLLAVTSDHRGHGDRAATEKDLGYFDKNKGWQKCVQDLQELTLQIKQQYPQVPVVLLGHSMGSIMARSYLKRYDSLINGLILSGAPNYNPLAGVGRLAAKTVIALKGGRYRSRFLNSLATGSFNRHIAAPRTEFDWLSKNEENVDAYLADPKCGFVFTAAAFDDLFYGMQDMHDLMRWNLKNPKMPVLFVAGEMDPVTGGKKGLESSAGLLHDAGYQDIETRVFKGLRHEILNEKEKAQVYSEILSWIQRKILNENDGKESHPAEEN